MSELSPHDRAKMAEAAVRVALALKHGQPFTSQHLPLATGGACQFDAVSEDRTIVAEVKSLSGRTSAGNLPQGKIDNCTAAMYFLTLVDAPTRLLVLTSEEMYDIFRSRLRGRIAPDVQVVHIPTTPPVVKGG